VLKGLPILAVQIQHEMIGRPLGKLSPPAIKKGTAQHAQGEEEHERRPKDQHLHNAGPLTPRQGCQPQAPGATGLHPQHPTASKQDKGERGEESRGAAEAQEHPARELSAPGVGEEKPQQGQEPQPSIKRPLPGGLSQIAA
jgi:hypothetical protein